MKQVFLFMVWVVGIVMILPSCQKDSEDAPQPKMTDGIESPWGILRPIPYDTAACERTLSKSGFAKKKSAVYFMDFDEESGEEVMRKYVTLKIRNIKGDLCQEWFLEDLRSNWFTYSNQPGDEDGSIHGYYYPWEGTLDDVEQSDWDELVYRTEDSNGDRENGFHIPNATDIINLRKIVGSNTVLQTLLTINNDGTCTPRTTQWGTSTGGFWQNPCDPILWSKFPCGIDPNKKDGCGVMLLYFLNDEVHGDALWTCYPEVKDIRCNVRLMRSIKKTQW